MSSGLSRKTVQIIGIIFGFFFLGLIVLFIWTTPCPSTAQYLIFRLILSVVLAILAGTFISGDIKLTYKIGITATSGFAVLVMFVFLKDPKSIDFLGRCGDVVKDQDSIHYKIQLIDSETKALVHFSNAILVVEAKELKGIITLPVDWGGIVTFSLPGEIRDSCRIELNNVASHELASRKYLLKKDIINEILVKQKKTPPPPPNTTPEYEMAGTVHDSVRKTAANVRVYTLDGTVDTRTDPQGHFRFKIKTAQRTIDLFYDHATLGRGSGTVAVGRKDIDASIAK